MAYTKHGHYIEGSSRDDSPPAEIAKCGGPYMCADCTVDAIAQNLKAQLKIADSVENIASLVRGLNIDDGRDPFPNLLGSQFSFEYLTSAALIVSFRFAVLANYLQRLDQSASDNNK